MSSTAQGGGGTGALRRERLLTSAGWHAALEQFARATGLAITLVDSDGRLRAGPYAPTPLAECLQRSGCWGSEAFCKESDAGAAAEAMARGEVVHRRWLDVLALIAIPVRLDAQPLGAVVAGWVFDNFPDPVSTDFLARQTGLSFAELWQIVRQQPPVSREKLNTYAALLSTLTEAFLREYEEFLQEQEQARELRALNRAGQRLTEATTVEEVGEAVVEAAMGLTGAARARLLVPSADGRWETAAGRGYADEAAVMGSLRIPVEGSDGQLLGIVEASEAGAFPALDSQGRVAALAAQAAVALQKARVIADLKRQRAALEHANRMKDEFLSVLSHELRTPLTPILGWVTLLRQKGEAVDRATTETALAAIERNAKQELHLVEEMLDLSRILNEKVRLEPVPTDPRDALAAAAATAQTLCAGRRLRLEVDAEQNLPHALADPKRLQQVLSNLVSNAVKFTPDGGRIALGARRSEDGDAVEFVVGDSGIGITAEVMRHIFDRFSQADSSTTRRYGGLGIGLSVVRGLVELHGGRVWVESDGEGRGSTFYVRLPAVHITHDAAAAPGPEPAHGPRREAADGAPTGLPAPRRAGRVLLIDDSADTLVVLRAMLEGAGHTVSTAGSAHEALALLSRGRFDAVLTDIGMPDADGFELLHRMHADEEFRRLPVVALTGYVTTRDREAVLAAGFDAHLAKPVEQSDLLDTLDAVLQSAKG